MYNQELEKLIELALADGAITEKEKAILFRKAKTLGIDEDEFEMVLEGRLQLKKQGDSQKRESVLKCPFCNEPIKSFELVCNACGYEIKGIEANKYIKELTKELENVRRQCDKNVYKYESDKDYAIEKMQAEVIKNFILPNTFEDLVGTFYFIGPKAKFKSGSDDYLVLMAWRAKLEEIFTKMQYMIRNEKDAQTFQNYYSSIIQASFFKRFWYGKSVQAKAAMFMGLFFIILIILIITLI